MDYAMITKAIKPLGRKAYGSIGHLPSSRLGPSDSCVSEGQARICTEKARDKHDTIIVQEKLDGSCVSVALIDDAIIPLTRAGYPALSSPFEQHHMFHRWVLGNESRFRSVLREGERVVGEWLAQAHGTIYEIRDGMDPFAVFDIMTGTTRMTFKDLLLRVGPVFDRPCLLHYGEPISVEAAMQIHAHTHWRCDEIEGVVYRVERNGKVDFLAKWVRPDKIDGKHLPEVSGKDAVWNWQ